MTDQGLRLLSWNVRDLLGDPLAVSRVIASAGADLVCLQEAPRWPGSRWRLAALARSTGLVSIAGGREAAGCALLAAMRVDVVEVRAGRLPVRGLRTRPRGWVRARVRLPAGPSLLVACVHLGLTQEERLAHAGLILDELEAWARPDEPVVVVGDLNEPPGAPSWTALGRLVTDAIPDGPPTFPARAPNRRIDAVLSGPSSLGPPGRLTLERVPDDVWSPSSRDVLLASDHVPVLVELAV